MISALLSSPQVRSALPVQRMDSSAAVTSQEEEKKKKSFVPSVEVSAAQSQAMSPRVGDFLVNQSARSSDKSSSSSDAISPTGLDGTAPPSPPAGGPPPGPPPSGADGGGQNGQGQGSGQGSGQGGFSDAESALSLLSGEDTTTGASSGNSSAVSGETENDGDADDLAAANSNRPQGANTRYAQQQQQAKGSGIFNVRFDDVGTYQFAASA